MRLLSPSEDGFSLVEVAISSVVVVVFFLAFASTLDTATDSLSLSRTHSQASALMTQEIEFARSLAWESLTLDSVDAAAPLLAEGAYAMSASEAGLVTNELLVVDPTGSISPHVSHSSENTQFAAWRYVTEAGVDLRRVVVLIEWETEGQTRRLRSSTLISRFGAVGRGSGSTSTTTVTNS
jgi:hypothetical protein